MKKIGIDIGGTFTDIVIMDDVTGEVIKASKVVSTPKNPAEAIIAYIDEEIPNMKEISLLTHGTTVATNAVVQMKGAKLGLITTKGHKDLLDIQRTNWLRMYDVTYQKPKALIPRSLRREVAGRTAYDGTILAPLDKTEILDTARELAETNKVEGICVCFLNSYVNPAQEQEVKEIIADNFPGTYVVTSSETLAEVLEYERFSTAVITAFLMPEMDKYLAILESFFGEKGLPRNKFMLMQGNGGMISSSTARQMPAVTVESGPAGGVTASQHVAELAGNNDVITFDMGGTTTDVCLVRRGNPYVTLDYKVGGHPMRFPLLDIYSIGAGGGSIAWIDEAGGLHVGPQSAGADPGPACYGFGGEEPTISDAHVVLGRLTQDMALGGKLNLIHSLAKEAVNKIASYYRISTEEAGASIIKIADDSMINALRVISVEKGVSPNDYTLVAYGGAGPMHAGALMKRLKIPKCIIPQTPGCHSALGLITADIKHDYVRSILQPIATLDIDFVHEIYQSLAAKAKDVLHAEGVLDTDMVLDYKCDMRYIGQAYVPVTTPFNRAAPKEKQLSETEETFHRVHQELYGHSGRQPAEIISLRITAIGKQDKPIIRARAVTGKPQPGKRKVYFEDLDRFVECDVLMREELPVGFSFNGPAVVHQMDTTTLLFHGQRATIDKHGSMLIEEN